MSKKVGRNDPCPCNSGKKFKKCCINKGITLAKPEKIHQSNPLAEFNKEFLGFDLCKDGIRPSKDRISDIIETKQPTNIRMLRGFIGAVGYYHWLIANRSHLMAPLHDLVTIADGDKRKFTWNQTRILTPLLATLD